MRDVLELEKRGVPVALITTTARLATVSRINGEFHLRHGFAGKICSVFDSPWAAKQAAKFGYHRALRMAGCRDGDVVHLAGGCIEWQFPDVDDELNWMPAGFGKWCSTADGARGQRSIEIDDPIHGLTVCEIDQRADEIVPQVISILAAPDFNS